MNTKFLCQLRRLLAVSAFASLLAACGNGSGEGGAAGGKPRIVATTTMVADLVREIGGDRIELAALMGPGVDPHTYKASSGDIAALRRADGIFYNGLMLEGRMAELFERQAEAGKPVFALGDSLPESDLIHPAEAGAHPDPHIWLDPALWAKCAESAGEELAKLDPAGAADYRARAAEVAARYRAAADWAKARIAEVPETSRVLVTSHDAFNYFGRAFGIEVVGVQGISTATEAGMADIVHTVDLIKARGIKAIFVETSVSKATIERISKDSGAKIGGELFSDALGKPGDRRKLSDGTEADVGTWEGMFRFNVDTAVAALR
ncbi:MAG: zinc ABC transporter substrate-binding protein [Verrucomicrobiales bacterium]